MHVNKLVKIFSSEDDKIADENTMEHIESTTFFDRVST